MSLNLAVLLLIGLIICQVHCEVIQLNSKNFEHLTQASTGATTGDWLIEFYAPWCGHCKSLQPIYERVADRLAGTINVAAVDVPASRDLGSRFEIKGFPTILFLKQGKVYQFKGRRTVEDIIEFATTGYLIQQPDDVPPELGVFGEIQLLIRQTYKQARKDILAKQYFTPAVFYILLPFIFLILLFLVLLIPVPGPDLEKLKKELEEKQE